LVGGLKDGLFHPGLLGQNKAFGTIRMKVLMLKFFSVKFCQTAKICDLPKTLRFRKIPAQKGRFNKNRRCKKAFSSMNGYVQLGGRKPLQLSPRKIKGRVGDLSTIKNKIGCFWPI
jgi:hypothetical protein